MSYQFIVTETAEFNALVAAIYYEEQLSGLGEQFVSELENTYRKIIEHPQYYGFLSSQDEFRDIGLRRFPYVVIYQIHNSNVIVIDVFNTNRNPVF